MTFALKTNGKIDVWEQFSPKVDFWVKRAKCSENDENELNLVKFSENDDFNGKDDFHPFWL